MYATLASAPTSARRRTRGVPPRRRAIEPSTTYATRPSTFAVSQPFANGYWWTMPVSMSALVSSAVSTTCGVQRRAPCRSSGDSASISAPRSRNSAIDSVTDQTWTLLIRT
jgi:hypothetical protein